MFQSFKVSVQTSNDGTVIFAAVQLKDYYSILELPPSASLDEIKKAYRRLAHQYHPDKKGSDSYAAVQFAEIKEAYETLTHPAKKSFYLQQRWYAQSMGQKITRQVVTPESILKKVLELNRYVQQLDVHRMDKESLYNHINELFSDDNIQKLNSFNEPSTTKQIILLTINTARPLPYRFAVKIAASLKKLHIEDSTTKDEIDSFTSRIRRAEYWDKRKTWLVFLIAVLLSLLILFL